MPTIQNCLVLPAAIVAMIVMSSTAAAQCDSNIQGNSAVGCSAGTCGGSCGQSGGLSNGRWPSSAGCASGNCGGGGKSLFGFKEGFEKYKADFALNQARNDAWPQPFACWDREAYHQTFNVSYQNGLQMSHMLTSAHFNAETNQLNRAGENVVGWIMQKATQANRQVFVYEDMTGPTMEQRLTSVSGFAERYYGHIGSLQIAKSQLKPNQVPADYQARTLESYVLETPSPRIPVQAGSTLQNAVTN